MTTTGKIVTVTDRFEDKSNTYTPEFVMIAHEGSPEEMRISGRIYRENAGTWGFELRYRYENSALRKNHGDPHHISRAGGIGDDTTAQLRAVGRAMGSCNGGHYLDWHIAESTRKAK